MLYTQIKHTAVMIFIAGLVICTIVVIFQIWGAFEDNFAAKAIQTVIALMISSALIGAAADARKNQLNPATANQPISVGRVIVYILIALIAVPLFIGFLADLSDSSRSNNYYNSRNY
jgi:hypothetical protein